MHAAGCMAWIAAAIHLFSFAHAKEKPNMVVILADDLGYSDLGCYGSEIDTPHLDAMARGGVLFTDFYSAARCCPTRASILTGLYPHQAGIGAMAGAQASNEEVPAYQGYLGRDCATLGEAMSLAGYHTAFSGKWHVGDAREEMLPHRRGFDRSFMTPGGAGCFFRLGWAGGKAAAYKLDGEDRMPGPGFYDTDEVFGHAIRFIRERPAGKPFFAFVSPRAPHWPLHAKPEDIAKYKGAYDCGWDAVRERRHRRQVGSGLAPAHWRAAPRGDGGDVVPAWESLPPEKRQVMAAKMEVYAAQVDSLDQNVGKLLGFLEAEGLLANTLVMFLSDNGADAEPDDQAFGRDWLNGKGGPVGSAESFESYGRGWAEVGNTPFRLWKWKAHEGGVATPLIAYWPNGIAARGSVNRQPGHVVDIMATCLDVGGGRYPERVGGNRIKPLAGISFAPVFRGAARKEHAAIAWEHFANRGLRAGKWKLVSSTSDHWGNARPGRWELYDLEADRTEMDDLAAAMPETVKELSARYAQWARQVGVVENTAEWRGKR